MNYSVICPPAAFTRDKHAEMVTKAIRKFNDRARVNERHDIVIDGGLPLPSSEWPLESDMHRTKYTAPFQPLKVSGSAYKMIRNRCLHHGTCLVASPNLASIGEYLRSPARAFLKARGVESVSSPVGNAWTFEKEGADDGADPNISPHTDEFEKQVVEAFADLYVLDRHRIERCLFQRTADDRIWSEKDWVTGFVGRQALDVKEIADGVKELKVCSVSIWVGFCLRLVVFSHPSGSMGRHLNSRSQAMPLKRTIESDQLYYQRCLQM